MAEIELTSTPVELGDNMYEQQEGVQADTNQKNVLMVDTAVAAVANDVDAAQVVTEADQMSAEELRTQATTNYQTSETALLNEAIETTAIEQPDALAGMVAKAPGRYDEIAKAGETKIAAQLGWVKSLPGAENKTEAQLKDIAADGLVLEAVANMLDGRAWYETGWDLLGAMAVPDESYNAAEVQSELLMDKTGLYEYLGSANAFKNISKFRMSLAAEERVLFDEHLINTIKDVDDNVLQQVGMVMDILEGGESAEFWQTFEKISLGIGAAPLGKALFKGLKSTNVLNRTAKAGDARTAAKTADAVSKDLGAAKEAGVPQMDAATLGNPVKPQGTFTGAPAGLQAEYRLYQGDVTDALQKATDTLVISARPGTKDADEIAAAVRRNLSKNDDIDNIEVEAGIEGVRIKYDRIEGSELVQERDFRVFTLDDLGGLEQEEASLIGSALRFATSPNTLTGKDRGFWVQQAEAATFAKGRIGKSYSDAVDAALAPVNGNKKSLAKINAVMKQLDGTDIEITYQKLVNEGIGGQKLNDKEFMSVVGLRRTLDDAWHTNNVTMRREMELRGTKSLDFNGEVAYARPYDDAEGAYKAFSGDTENTIIVDEAGLTHNGMGLDELQKAYSEGKTLVRNEGSSELEWFSSPDGFVRYALVERGAVEELPDIVLNRVKNYLPKMREDANYFVKNKRQVQINGTNKNRDVTVAYAATESQAMRYLDRLRKTADEAGEQFVEDDWIVLFDREAGSTGASSDGVSARGGLVRGKRKSTELDWAGDFDEGGRTDTLDSIQRYMGITADKASMSEWRMSARQQVINAAEAVPTIGEKALKEDWAGLRATIVSANMPPQRRAKLLAMYDQTSTMSMLPTQSDQAFQGMVRALGVKFDRAGKEGIAKYLYKMQDKSPVDIMKGATFNLTLGAFNLVQIPVQMLGATVAFSMDPVHAIRGSSRWLTASALDFVTNEKAAKAFLDKMSKDLGQDVSSMANDYAAWRKSGMYESVVRGSADASSIANRLPYDAGFLRKGFNSAVEAGQAPYRMGELSNMRISFFTALEREKALKGAAFKYDDATITRVVSRAEQYRLNMSGANKAPFQKGIWALPTQFKQIYTKYLESIGGSHFTGSEKAKLVLGQFVLFGAAGVPIINYGIDNIISSVYGEDVSSLSAEELTRYKRGALGWMLNHELDIDALISGRLTVNADVIEEIHKSFFDTKTPMLASMLGSSYLTGDKAIDLVKNMTMAGGLIVDDMLEGEELTPVMKETAIIMARSFAGLASSSRKWMAAYDLTEGWVRKSDGMPLYQVVDPELRDIVARGVGFGSQETTDLYSLVQADYKRKDLVRDLSTRYISIIHDLDMSIQDQSEFKTEAAQKAASMIRRQIDRLHPDDASEVWRNVQNRIAKPRDFKEKTLRDAVLNSVGDLTNAANKASIEKQKFIEGLDSGR